MSTNPTVTESSTEYSNQFNEFNSSADLNLVSKLAFDVVKIAQNCGFEMDSTNGISLFSNNLESSHNSVCNKDYFELMSDLIEQNNILNKILVQIHQLKTMNSSSEFTKFSFLNQKFEICQEIFSHIRKIVENKALIMQELQHPTTANYIPMKHAYHSFVLDFVKISGELINNSTEYTESYKWLAKEDWNTNHDNLMANVNTEKKSVAELKQSLYYIKSVRESLIPLLESKKLEL